MLFCVYFNIAFARNQFVNEQHSGDLPCLFYEAILNKSATPKQILEDKRKNEAFTQNFVKQLKLNEQYKKLVDADYTIPIVLHIFNNGEDGHINEAQIDTAINALNINFNDLNDDFNNVHQRFDSIKATLNITIQKSDHFIVRHNLGRKERF